MTVQRMFFHAVAIAALGAMCLAQTSTGTGSTTGPSNSMGQEQQGMGQHQPSGANTPSSMNRETGTDHSSTYGTTNKTMKSPDSAFIRKAAQGGMAEVQLGNLAERNAASGSVKQFGNMMVADHSKANKELQRVAREKGITIPASLDAKDKQVKRLLESKHGSSFDKAYVRDMVKDHEADVAEFRNEAENGKDPDVKAFAQKTLPTLEEHLAKAKEIAGEVGVGTVQNTPGAMSSHQK
jgi:putative membrane protein